MTRPYRQTRQPKLPQDATDVALGDIHAKPCLDLRLKIDAAPTHHAMYLDIRAVFDQPRKLGQLYRVQPRSTPRPRQVAKTGHARLIVADHPVPQRLAIHPTCPGRYPTGRSFQHESQRHQTTRLIAILRTSRRRPQVRRR